MLDKDIDKIVVTSNDYKTFWTQLFYSNSFERTSLFFLTDNKIVKALNLVTGIANGLDYSHILILVDSYTSNSIRDILYSKYNILLYNNIIYNYTSNNIYAEVNRWSHKLKNCSQNKPNMFEKYVKGVIYPTYMVAPNLFISVKELLRVAPIPVNASFPELIAYLKTHDVDIRAFDTPKHA